MNGTLRTRVYCTERGANGDLWLYHVVAVGGNGLTLPLLQSANLETVAHQLRDKAREYKAFVRITNDVEEETILRPHESPCVIRRLTQDEMKRLNTKLFELFPGTFTIPSQVSA